MKRGMLPISINEIKQLVQFLPKNTENQFLISKFQSGIESPQNPTQILINEEELDIIMDNLPIPTQTENSILSKARQTVQKKLSQMRFSG